MRVITLINGSLISQTSAVYALSYAKKMGAPLDIIHIRSKDPIEEVRLAAEELQNASSEVITEFFVFDTFKEFEHYLDGKEIDIIFCSTRHDHSLFDKSFAQTLIRAKLPADLAISKILKPMQGNIEKIVLPIRSTKLSVEKFSFFTALSEAYNAKATVYAIDKSTKSNILSKSVLDHKKRLQEIIFDLRHYLRFSHLFDFKLSIKHDYSVMEGNQIKAHIADHNYDLAIVGGHRSHRFFDSHPIDILFSRPMLNTIYFIPYEERS